MSGRGRGRSGGWRGGWRGRGGRGSGRGRSGTDAPASGTSITSDAPPPGEDGRIAVAVVPSSAALSAARARRMAHQARPDLRCVGWHLYFPDEPYDDKFPYKDRIKNLKEYFMSKPDLFAQTTLEQHTVVVNYQDLEKSFQDPASQELPLGDDIRDQPDLVLRCMSLAFYQAWTAVRVAQDSSSVAELERVDVRLTNFTPITPLRRLKANYIGKFVAIRGTVVRVSNIRPLVTQMLFRCTRCGSGSQILALPDGKFVAPTSCDTDGCRSRSFQPDRTAPETKTIDFQTIRLQEIMQDDHRESGRIPRTVDCELLNDLVDSCVPGDVVTVCGEVKVVSADSGPDKGLFLIYIQAHGIANNRKPSETGESGADVIDEHSTSDLYLIQEIQKQPDIFRLIVHSMCPSIYGQEQVKAGLALALFGGSSRGMDDRNSVPLRCDPHVLVVGDPGLGKSQMLQHLSTLTPRGVYVCGNTTSNAGLTVTLHKDAVTGDYALEAGALVLGDQGCCCIDEFDKMGNQHQALLEAMEQQSISIAKAGIVCSLPARTSIVAAANPVGGHYNKARTVSENLKMGSALLSRFDLVFILLDEANEEHDRMLSEHVMAMHTSARNAESSVHSRIERHAFPFGTPGNVGGPLLERLTLRPDEQLDPLFPQQLRKYVAYARKYVHPRLSEQAAGVLQEFYLDLRQRHQSSDATPITTRQLESLIRLSQARARAELREIVVEQDALDVIELMRISLYDTFCDEFGRADIQNGSGMSKTQQAKYFISRLNQVAEETYNSLFSKQQLRELMQEMGMDVGSFEAFIASLNNQGYLLKRGPRSYQLRTVDL